MSSATFGPLQLIHKIPEHISSAPAIPTSTHHRRHRHHRRRHHLHREKFDKSILTYDMNRLTQIALPR